MTLWIILLILISLDRLSCQSIHHCMYTESFECASTPTSQMAGQDYYFTFNWNSTQSSITASTYSLAGYQMASMNKYMSFVGLFYTVTSTYGNFEFIPVSSSFFKARFYFILFRFCTDQIIVRQVAYTGSSNSILSVSAGFTFGTNANAYISNVFFKYIYQAGTPVAVGSISISLLAIISGTSYQRIQVNTSVSISIAIGYILLVKKSNEALQQTVQSYSATGYQPLRASFIYAPNGQYKCFLGLNIFTELPNSLTPYSLKSAKSPSNSTYEVIYDYTKSSFNQGKFLLFCLAQCDSAIMVPDYSSSPLSCIIAQLPKCSQLINSTHCKICQNRYYVNINSTCDLCSIVFPNCDHCTNFSCTICYENFMLYTQGSSISCATCNIVIENCLTCHSDSCLSCYNGFYLISFCPYPNNCTYKCLPCLQECFSCENGHTCIECKIGSWAEGGCTDIPSCIKINTSISYNYSRCIECSYPALLNNNRRCDKCRPNYFYAPPYCIKTIGCIVTAKINQTLRCITCDFNKNFVMRPNDSRCYCHRGFSLVNVTCLDICGDGQTYTAQCDDGNTVNGDGCSSNCVIENGFSCINSQNQTSQCKYYRKDIILKLEKIEKVRLQNKAIMSFAFHPKLSIDKLVNISEGFTFITNRSIIIENKQVQGNILTLWIHFNEDLEDHYAILTIIFRNITFSQLKAELEFKMQRNGLLIIVRNLQLLKLKTKFMQYFVLAIMIIYMVSLFFHKIIGLQFLFPFQIIYLTYISNLNPTPFLSVLNPLGFSCFDFLLYFNYNTNVSTLGKAQDFNLENMQNSIVIISISLVGLFILKMIRLITKDQSGNRKGKLQYLFFVMDNFLFSLSISFMMISFMLLIGESMRYRQTFFKILMFPLLIIISFEYFQEWRINLFNKGSTNTSIVMPHSPKQLYSPVFLTAYLLASLILVISARSLFYQIQVALLFILLVLLTLIIAIRPYKTFLDNLGAIFGVFFAIFAMLWFKIRNQIEACRKQQNQLLILIVMIATMIVTAIITIVRIVKVIKSIYRQYSPDEQLGQTHTNNMSNDQCYFRQLQKQKQNKKQNKYSLREDIPFSEFKQVLHKNNQHKLSLLKLIHEVKRKNRPT